MKITHYSNSFFSIESQGKRIICDPWVGKANSGGWQSYPEFSFNSLAKELMDVEWVYISHLHDDHFHPETLQRCELLDRKFIIKRFEAPVLKNRLKRLGVQEIYELEPFTVNKFKPFQLTVFPQMTSTSSGLEDDINYDLDTSIVIGDGSTVFFNQVDNPLSIENLSEINKYICSNYGKIDIACMMSGAASEYPHLFLGVDQESEKEKIVNSSLIDLVKWLSLIKPAHFFPAGGTYMIPGWMSIYNKNIAQPSYCEIISAIAKAKLPIKPHALEGGNFINLESGKEVGIGNALQPLQNSVDIAIEAHSSDKYEYCNLKAPAEKDLTSTLNLAKINWINKIAKDSVEINQSITFLIYKNLQVENNIPVEKNLIFKYQLFKNPKKNNGDLFIHIDQRALFGCLTKRLIWNGVLGSLCLFERIPNIHYPSDFFSLNYLVLHKEQVDSK